MREFVVEVYKQLGFSALRWTGSGANEKLWGALTSQSEEAKNSQDAEAVQLLVEVN